MPTSKKMVQKKSEDDCADHGIPIAENRKVLDLLVHASECGCAHCGYPICQKVKRLFRHGIRCQTRASGGCLPCNKMWYLLQLHARACNQESQCRVPRCRDLKEHFRRQKSGCEGQIRDAELNNS